VAEQVASLYIIRILFVSIMNSWKTPARMFIQFLRSAECVGVFFQIAVAHIGAARDTHLYAEREAMD